MTTREDNETWIHPEAKILQSTLIEHCFFHCLYKYNIIITGKSYQGQKMLRIIYLFFPVTVHISPKMNINLFNSAKGIIKQLFSFQDSFKSSK